LFKSNLSIILLTFFILPVATSLFGYWEQIEKLYESKFSVFDADAKSRNLSPYFNMILMPTAKNVLAGNTAPDGQKVEYEKILNERLRALPGIVEIKKIEKKEINSGVAKGLKLTGTREGLQKYFSEISTGAIAVKIFLEKENSEKVYVLVKEYLVKLFGEDSIGLGNLKDSRQKTGNLYVMLAQYQSTVYMSVGIGLATLWLLIFTMFAQKMARYCYLLEKFQRQRWTFVKLSSLLFIPAMALFLLQVAFLGMPSLLGASFFLAQIVITLSYGVLKRSSW